MTNEKLVNEVKDYINNYDKLITMNTHDTVTDIYAGKLKIRRKIEEDMGVYLQAHYNEEPLSETDSLTIWNFMKDHLKDGK